MANEQLEQKRVDAKSKEEQRQAATQRLIEIGEAVAHELIEEKDTYYVTDQGLFFQFIKTSADGEYRWIAVKGEALKNSRPIEFNLGPEVWRSFMTTLEQEGRIKDTMTTTFDKNLPANVLNRLRLDSWAPRVEGQHSEYFDLLLTCLASGRENVKEYLEKAITHKLVHPEDSSLPALVIYGAGGSGKNLLIERVLGTLFGKEQLVKFSSVESVKSFQEGLEGKSLVLFDETTVQSNKEMEMLKGIVGVPRLSINPKGAKHFMADNTAWYFFTNNNHDRSPVMLSGDGVMGSDRRWSIIRCHKLWVQVLHQYMVENVDQSTTQDQAHRFSMNDLTPKVFGNRLEVGKWRNYLETKWGSHGNPGAFHDEDYSKLKERQITVEEQLVRDVFLSSDFRYVGVKTLYALYNNTLGEQRRRGGMSFAAFKEFLANAVQDLNAQGLVKIDYNQTMKVYVHEKTRNGLGNKVRTNRAMYLNAAFEQPKTLEDNDDYYMLGNYLDVVLRDDEEAPLAAPGSVSELRNRFIA